MNQVVLITGASKGMGKETGIFLQSKGFTVYGTARRPENYPVHPFPLIAMDLENENSIREAVHEIVRREGKIDVLINNAGRGMMGPLEETPQEDLKTLFQTNVFGPVEIIKQVLPVMRRQKSGLIINITSVAGFTGLPFRGGYSASKSAFMILTETLRYELYNSGIQITEICPGDIATDIASGRIYTEVDENSPYFKTYQRILQEADREVKKGLPPMAIAEKVSEIIRENQPAPRYIVAPFMQKILHVAKAVLPGKIFEKLIRNHYKIQ